MSDPSPTEFWLNLAYQRPPLSLNDRKHWAIKARTQKSLRRLAFLVACQHKVTQGAEKARVTLVYNPPDARRRDQDNLFATLKPCIDGLTDYGLTEDDDWTRIESACRIGEVRKPGQVWLHVEVTA